MTIWQKMDELKLSRQQLAEASGLSPAEVTDLCTGKKAMAQCGEEILARLAETLECSAEELLELEPAGMTYVMVYGEALAILYAEAAQGLPPEEILTKDHLAELFLSTADRYGREDERRTYYEAWYQEESNCASLGEFICEKVFNIKRNRDLFEEYGTLKDQLDDCQQSLEKRMRELEPTGGKKGTDKNGKPGYLYKAAAKKSKELAQRAKPEMLVDQAFRNVTSGPLSLWPRRDFQMEIPRLLDLERDYRTVIFFENIPFHNYWELMKLAQTDHEAYLDVFEKMILDRNIPKQLRRRTEQNVYLHDRAGIMRAAVELFEAENYQPFVHLLVPQIEGLLRIYQSVLSRDAGKGGEAPLGMRAAADKINDLGSFLEYTYFAFDFCDELRNPIAHGEVVEADRERAYEVLMDAWWLVERIDSPDCGYQRWLKLVRECAVHKDDTQAIGCLLGFFSGLDGEENMALLKRRLNHDFVKEAAWYDVTEEAKRVDGLLRSQGFYDRIWSGRPAQDIEETVELGGKEITIHRIDRCEDEDQALVELLHRFKAVPEAWYKRYIQHCKESECEFDRTLVELMAKKGKDKLEKAAQSTAEGLSEGDHHGQIT